ncbi:MAG: hypothetical protein KDK76_07250 [Chlamydiia bacterium]|nr:hypothetical protein [Chlamydiia bacterium]
MRTKLFSAATTLLLSVPLFGHMNGQDKMEQSRQPKLEEQSTFVRGAVRNVTPAAGPRVADGVNLTLSADFLWWKARQDGLAYATSGILSNVGNALTSRGEQHFPDFGWDPGFKFGFGVALPWDNWDFMMEYTWLYSHHNTDRVRDINGNIAQSLLIGSLTRNTTELTSITSARSSWDLHFNTIDLELGRNFYVSQYLTLRPFGGLKWTWQDQNWSATYNADSVSVNGSATTTGGGVRMVQDHFVWGVGVRTGLDTQWYFTNDWSIFINTALSAMWNDYSVDRRDRFQPSDQSIQTTTVRTKSSPYQLHGVTEFQLGIMGEWWFYNNDFHLAVSAAYEQQVWINYGAMIYLIDREGGDLSLHGLTLKFRFDF